MQFASVSRLASHRVAARRKRHHPGIVGVNFPPHTNHRPRPAGVSISFCQTIPGLARDETAAKSGALRALQLQSDAAAQEQASDTSKKN
jgi:hypothetical protein